MTELEIKVKDGKIYLPKSFAGLYKNQKEVILWFRQTGYSKLLHDLGLTKEESENLEQHSNQIVCIRTDVMFDEFLASIKKVFENEQENLIQKSKDLAYEDLPVGAILSEKTDCSIVGDKMFAVTIIDLFGIIH